MNAYKSIPVATYLLVMASLVPASAQEASDATRSANDALKSYLPFDDQSDFEDAKRGFIATLDDPRIIGENGNIVYDFSQFDFLKGDKGDAPDTANPSLWRQRAECSSWAV